MKKVLIILSIWLIFVIFIVFKTVTSSFNFGKVNNILNSIEKDGCGNNPPRVELFSNSELAAVRKLGEVENKCNSVVTNNLMYFTIMPKDSKSAKLLSDNVSKHIISLNNLGLSPIVIIEPDSEWGLIDFKEFNTGFYDGWIDEFFKNLKSTGITDEMMGMWVPFPEANLPYWNHQNTTPDDFAKAVNRYLRILKKHFPNAKTSILLNSATYPTDDFNWAEGEYVSLIPYLEGIDKKLITSFGLQGLPWMPASNEPGKPIFEPAEYLSQTLAAEAADKLGVKEIWFNTGTFAAKYVGTEGKTLVPPSFRKEILDKTLTQAQALETRGYNVTINLFAEDKSQVAEATDWSYFGSEFTNNEGHTLSLIGFLKDAYKKGVEVSFHFK